jgi:hypothetical protein
MSARPHPRLAAPSQPAPEIDHFRAQHLKTAARTIPTKHGRAQVVVDEQESPLAWLARRRGRGGRALIASHQLQAGERLRSDFTLAQLMPRTTSNWANPLASGPGAGDSAMHATDTMVAARQRVHLALDAVGPEMSGLLLDVCCFLKRLDDVERERVWPTRSAKLVLQIALDRLARHYGYAGEARGRSHAKVRTWVEEEDGSRVE